MRKLTLISFGLAVALLFAVRAEAQVIVIVNPGVKTVQTTKSELRDVFTGDSRNLKDGSRVMPVLLQGGATHQEFLSGYIHEPDSELRQGWRKLMFAGQSILPKSFDDEAAVVAYVAHTPGSIGYINSGTAHDGVKVLAVK